MKTEVKSSDCYKQIASEKWSTIFSKIEDFPLNNNFLNENSVGRRKESSSY